MNQFTKSQKIIFFSLIGILLVAILISITTLVSRIGKIPVQVKYAPYTATVKLNNVPIKNNATNYLTPGTYEVIVELEHFETLSSTITIDSSSEYLLGQLIPIDEEGQTIANRHQKEYAEVEGIYGQIASDEGAAIKDQYPILNYIPINNNFYSISFRYESDTPGKPIITVKAEPLYLDIAVQKLLSFPDVNPAEYDISFTTNNPFLNTQTSTASDPKTFIQESYPSVINDQFIFKTEQSMDDYFVAIIYRYDQKTDTNYSHYRIIIKKDGNTWQTIATPQPLLTTTNTPNINLELLATINSL